MPASVLWLPNLWILLIWLHSGQLVFLIAFGYGVEFFDPTLFWVESNSKSITFKLLVNSITWNYWLFRSSFVFVQPIVQLLNHLWNWITKNNWYHDWLVCPRSLNWFLICNGGFMLCVRSSMLESQLFLSNVCVYKDVILFDL